ncbi:MAG: Crp/Fnr family transcriptional regulator [Pleomorphochaeta sp.]
MEYEINKILPFYNKLRTSDKLALDRVSRKKMDKGTMLPRCSGVLCVLEGRLRVYIVNENGKEITLYRLFSGDVCVLSGSCGIRNISFEVHVKSEIETTLCTIPSSIYHNLEEKYPEVTSFSNSVMAERLSDVMWTLEQVAFSSMDKRVASYLVEQRAMSQCDDLSITHDEIARDLGTAREVISRMLKYFQNEGWIIQGRGRVSIKDYSALYDLSA